MIVPAEQVPACLGNENPNRLVSLLNIVQNYNVWVFVKAMGFIMENESNFRNLCQTNPTARDAQLSEEIRALISNTMEFCKLQFELLELSGALARIDGPIRVKLRDGITFDEACTQMRVLREVVEADLSLRRFVRVPVDRAVIWDGLEKEWGDTWARIPECRFDAQESVCSYAADLNTASVFHSMRVAGTCLRALARHLKVKLTHGGKPQPVELADWGKIIDGCTVKINQARQSPKGVARQRKLELYSEAAQHCTFMKDIWRNSVSHERGVYIAPEALTVLNRVRDFAQFVASKVLKKPVAIQTTTVP